MWFPAFSVTSTTNNELLFPVSNIVIPLTHKNVKHVFHLYVISTENRDKLQNHLKENGISTGIHYPTALPYLKAYDYLEHSSTDFPVAYEYPSKILSLPIFPEIEKADIIKIVSVLKKAL